MKTSFLILFCLSHFLGNAQSLYGFVLEQNSNKNPVEGVKLKSTFGANQVSTDRKGNYKLSFQGGSPGESVILSLEKQNWVITDEKYLMVNLPREPLKNPHTIVICRKDVWEQQNKDYKAALVNYINESHKKEKAALNKLDKKYQIIVDSLQDKYTRLLKELIYLSEEYCKMNLDDVTEKEKTARMLFKSGRIDECIALRKSFNSKENFLKAIETGEKIDAVRIINDSTKKIHKINLRALARESEIVQDNKTADESWRTLAINDSTDVENLSDYAVFLQRQDRHSEAILWFKKALKVVNNEQYKSAIIQFIGEAYFQLKIYDLSKKNYLESSELSRKLVKNGLHSSEILLVRTLLKLAETYGSLETHEDSVAAKRIYFEVLSIQKRQIDNNEISVKNLTLTIIGLSHFLGKEDLKFYEDLLLSAIEIYKVALKSYPKEFEFEFCKVVVMLGTFYLENLDEEKINEYFKYGKMADSILSKYPDNNKVKSGKKIIDNMLTNSDVFKIDSLEKRRELATLNSEKIVIQKQLIGIARKLTSQENIYADLWGPELGNLSWFLLLDKQFYEAEIVAKEALFPSFKDLPNDYVEETEWVNTNLAHALLFQGKYSEAKKIYLDLIDKPYKKTTYKETFLSDLDELEKAGITHKDVEKIRTLLKK